MGGGVASTEFLQIFGCQALLFEHSLATFLGKYSPLSWREATKGWIPDPSIDLPTLKMETLIQKPKQKLLEEASRVAWRTREISALLLSKERPRLGGNLSRHHLPPPPPGVPHSHRSCEFRSAAAQQEEHPNVSPSETSHRGGCEREGMCNLQSI